MMDVNAYAENVEYSASIICEQVCPEVSTSTTEETTTEETTKSPWIEIDVPIDDGPGTILENITPENVDDLLEHGCHCYKFNGYSDNHLGGAGTVDDMDEICKIWRGKLKCLE